MKPIGLFKRGGGVPKSFFFEKPNVFFVFFRSAFFYFFEKNMYFFEVLFKALC